jgi:hypothetical protein
MRVRPIALAIAILACAALLASCSQVAPTARTESPSSPATTTAQPSGVAASSVTWKGFFGSNHSKPDVVYSLLGVGYFRAPTSRNIDTLVKQWLVAHPGAKLIAAWDNGEPMFVDKPDSRLIWAWLVDGESNLNLELVRQGACPAGTQAAPDAAHVLISEGAYRQFESQLPALEKLAKQDKRGIWK